MPDAGGKRIIIVCTFGAGSSQLLKMNVDNALRELGVTNVIVEVSDSGSFKGTPCDGIICDIPHAEIVKGHPKAKASVAVKGIFDKADIKAKVRLLLEQLGVQFD